VVEVLGEHVNESSETPKQETVVDPWQHSENLFLTEDPNPDDERAMAAMTRYAIAELELRARGYPAFLRAAPEEQERLRAAWPAELREAHDRMQAAWGRIVGRWMGSPAPPDNPRVTEPTHDDGGATNEFFRLWAQTFPHPKRRRRGDQQKIAQPTYAEYKVIALAIADGPTGRNWTGVDGETAMRHVAKEDAALQVKLVGAPFSTWLGLPMSVEGLKEVLRRGGIPAILVQGLCVQLATESPRVTILLDDMIALLGWEPRSTAAREKMHAKVWEWLVLCEALHVMGARPGRYPDPLTKRPLDLTSRDPLIRITGQRFPPQLAFTDGVVPTEVTWVAGEWLEQFRGNRSVLSSFGDIRKLAAIPAGKVGGAWAQAVGLALNQVWREQSSYAEVNLTGDHKRATVKFEGLTARRLLTMFEPDPPLEKFIVHDHPQLVRKHFEEALKILKNRGLVGHFDAPPSSESRLGWIDRYLDHPRDIRPSRESMADAVVIKNKAKAARKRLTSRAGARAGAR
jgi:hypothetical protein